MSTIPGSGIQEDPYIVSTWTDLVNKAATSNTYIKLGADIDVLAEYPDGDMPSLLCIANIDGDGKTISRMYKTGSNFCILFSPSYNGLIENVNFTNINTNYTLIKNQAQSSSHINIKNCKFAGRISSGYILGRGENVNYYSGRAINSSFNFKGGDLKICDDYYTQTYSNCNIKLDTNATWLIYNNANNNGTIFENCYLEINAPNITSFGDSGGTAFRLENCALDLTTPRSLSFNYTSNTTTSIFNQTHAQSLSPAGNIKAVENGDWTNVSALQAVGFDIVEVAE